MDRTACSDLGGFDLPLFRGGEFAPRVIRAKGGGMLVFWVEEIRPQLMKRPAGTHKRTESERHAALAASSGAGWSGVNPALFSVIYCPVIVRCGFRRSPPVCAENLSGAVSARYLIPT